MDINETIAAVRKARFVSRLTIKHAYGAEYVATQRELDKATPVTDIDSWLGEVDTERVTTAELAKLMTLKSTHVLVGDDLFPIKALSKAKEIRVLEFPYRDWTAELDNKGMLTIGCQTHSLDEWMGSPGDSVISSRRLWEGESSEELEAARSELIPILRKKLDNELAKQQPAKRKKAA